VPIRPENRARYPKNWKEIVAHIRKRSRNRCEFIIDGKRCKARNGKPHPDTGSIVVLTVAHLDHQPENNANDNLKHACQRCHNRYDAPMRRAGIQARARAQRAIRELL
jgi:hypothetical protein